jgi:hypothetical protein
MFYKTSIDNIFFSAAHGSFSKIDHILGHNARFKYKKTEITYCILSDHNGIKPDININRLEHGSGGVAQF